MSEQFPFPEIEPTKDSLPRIPLEEVIGLRDFAMRDVRVISRREYTKRNPKHNIFSIFNKSNPDATVDTLYPDVPEEDMEALSLVDIDTYMTIRNFKPTPWQWRFSVNFFAYPLDKDSSQDFVRDSYRFEWDRMSTEAIGTRRIERSIAETISEQTITVPNKFAHESTIKRAREVELYPLFIDDCQELREKMRHHVVEYLSPRIIDFLDDDEYLKG